LFDGVLVGRQGLAPIGLELGAKCSEPFGIWVVDPTSPSAPIDYQPGLLQDLEVLGDRRPADRQLEGKLADRSRTIGQSLEDRASSRVP
jgi:hypothetical protein